MTTPAYMMPGGQSGPVIQGFSVRADGSIQIDYFEPNESVLRFYRGLERLFQCWLLAEIRSRRWPPGLPLAAQLAVCMNLHQTCQDWRLSPV